MTKKECRRLKVCRRCYKPLIFLTTQPNAMYGYYAKCSCGKSVFGRGIENNSKRYRSNIIKEKSASKKHNKFKHTIKEYAGINFKRFDKYEMKVYYLLKAFFDFEIDRQFIINNRYIADLYLPGKKLVIEIDGEYHNTDEQKVQDKEREDYIKENGLEIMRFKNEDVKDNLLGVLEILQEKFPTPEQKSYNEYKLMVGLANT